ncbi:MAG TPA: hypothetical protein PLV83_01290 [Bacilli bacterium]|nr:hypothetical protein [Bacilli bacterium]
MKKKFSLFYGIIVCFAIYILLSWFIPTASVADSAVTAGSTNPVGLFGIVYYGGLTIGTFIQFGLIILAIGGFYGVISKTGVYSKLVDEITKKVAKKDKLFLCITAILFAILNSILGVPFAIMVLVPLFMEVIIKLGYKKIIAFTATIGAMLVGSLASTYGYNVAGSATALLGISINSGILFRFILLAISLLLFVLFILNGKVKEETKKAKKGTKKEEIIEEEQVLFFDEKEKSKKNTLPIKVLMGLTFLLAIVSMYNWNAIFKVDIFETFYEEISKITIGDYPILSNILDLTYPFGYWDSYELVTLMLIGSLLIGWVYSLKFKEILEGFIEGAKKFLKPAIYITLANIIFTVMLSASSGTMLTWITDKFAGMTKEFNLFAVSLSSIFGGFFYNHFYYLFKGLSDVFAITYTTDYSSIIIFITQSVYGLLMMFLPTSLFLVAGLSMLDISYKEWLKYIWKYLIQILIIVLVLSVILVLMV